MGVAGRGPAGRSARAERGRVVAGLFALGAAAACTPQAHWSALREELAALDAARASFDAPHGYVDLRGAIHVHSFLSFDSEGRPEEILAGARAADLDFVMMTEHETPALFAQGLAGWRDDVLVIPGMEIIKGCRGLANRCATLLAIGLESYFDPEPLGLQELVDEINRQGGLAFVAHPRGWRDWSIEGIAGIEIYDVLDDVLDKGWKFPRYFFDILHSYDEYAEEVFLSIQDRPDWHLRRWDELVRQRRTVGIAGNDAHQNVRVLGRQLDPYSLSFRYVTTHLWAWSHDREAILSALAAGHAYVAFDRLADATGFWFATGDPGELAIQGDEVALRYGLKLRVRAPLAGRIVLLRDGVQVGECECGELSLAVERPGVYRAEVFLPVRDRWRPWIFSNPIYVR